MSGRRPRELVAFLVDSHLSRALATALTDHGCDARHLADWRDGAYRNATDAELLALAAPEGRTIITFDSATLPLDAYACLDVGTPFPGVLVVTRAIGQRTIGAQVRAVLRAIDDRESRANQVIYLPPASEC